MKALVKTMMVAAVLAASTAYAAPDSVRVLTNKRYIVYFKVDKRLIGGKVEILDKDSVVVEKDDILTAKTIVDFFYLKPGKYTIRISKGTEEFTIPYDNKE